MSGSPPAPWWNVSVVALLVSCVVFSSSRTFADPDLWWHLKVGDDLWRTWDFFRPDTFSYLSGERAWVNHSWLAEAIASALYGTLGVAGLVGAKVLVALTITFVVCRRLVRQDWSLLAAGLVTAYSLFAILPGLGSLRPQVFTYLFFLFLLLIIDRAEDGRYESLWLAAPLFGLWVNLHGGFVAGLAALLFWGVVHFVDRYARGRPLPARPMALPMAAAMLATLASPWGAGLWHFMWTDGMWARNEITEWQPLDVLSVEGAEYLAMVTGSLVAIASSDRPKRVAPLVIFAWTALLPLVARRHTPFLVLTMLVFVGDQVGDAISRWAARRWPARQTEGSERLRPWTAGVIATYSVAILLLSVPHFRRIALPPDFYPVRAVQVLKASGVAGNMAVFFDWGGYAIWHLAPAIKVSIDSRRELVYSERAIKDHLAFTYGIGDWSAVLRRGTGLALVSRDVPTIALLGQEPGWTLVYEDELCAVFARVGSREAELIRQAAVRRDASVDTYFP